MQVLLMHTTPKKCLRVLRVYVTCLTLQFALHRVSLYRGHQGSPGQHSITSRTLPLHPALLDRVQQVVSEQLKISDTLEECEQGGHDLTSILLEAA